MARYEPLPEWIHRILIGIEPSYDRGLEYYPCSVVLKDGTRLDTVYLVAEKPYLVLWRAYPEDGEGQHSIDIADIAEVKESSARLPAKFANEIYQRGESGMGYTIFAVVFTDGTLQSCVTGNAVDFIRYPEGKGPEDVLAVMPHEGRDDPEVVSAPEWHWCLYSE